MEDFINRLEDNSVKEWFERYTDQFFRIKESFMLNANRYTLDKNSGFFLKSPYRKDPNYTLIDIAFLRPTDLHYHEDVEEVVKVIGGQGALFVGSEHLERNIENGYEEIFPTGVAHAFRPNKNSFLELRIACNGILDSSKEICVKKFDEIPEWNQYFSSTNGQ